MDRGVLVLMPPINPNPTQPKPTNIMIINVQSVSYIYLLFVLTCSFVSLFEGVGVVIPWWICMLRHESQLRAQKYLLPDVERHNRSPKSIPHIQ